MKTKITSANVEEVVTQQCVRGEVADLTQCMFTNLQNFKDALKAIPQAVTTVKIGVVFTLGKECTDSILQFAKSHVNLSSLSIDNAITQYYDRAFESFVSKSKQPIQITIKSDTKLSAHLAAVTESKFTPIKAHEQDIEGAAAAPESASKSQSEPFEANNAEVGGAAAAAHPTEEELLAQYDALRQQVKELELAGKLEYVIPDGHGIHPDFL